MLQVQIPDTSHSFALIYSIEDPDGANEHSGVGVQVSNAPVAVSRWHLRVLMGVHGCSEASSCVSLAPLFKGDGAR